MNRILQHSIRLYTKVTAVGASLSMILLFSIVFINAVRRYSIGKSLEWGEELPIFVAIFGVMFGTAWAYIENRHIRFTMLVGFLPEAWRRKLFLLVDLVVAASGALLAWSGWLFTIKRGGLEASGIINLAKGIRTLTGWQGAIWIGHQYPYMAAMVLGGVLLTVAALMKLFSRFSETETPGPAGE